MGEGGCQVKVQGWQQPEASGQMLPRTRHAVGPSEVPGRGGSTIPIYLQPQKVIIVKNFHKTTQRGADRLNPTACGSMGLPSRMEEPVDHESNLLSLGSWLMS